MTERLYEPCGCGCGELPRPGKGYVHGHNSRRSPVAFVVDDHGCWVWQRSTWKCNGRPRMKVAGRWVQAYKRYYEGVHGPVPAGLTLDHLCRNYLCVNPAHLEPVTLRENIARHRAHVRETAHQNRTLDSRNAA